MTIQDYFQSRSCKVLVADAGSTDGTQEIVLGYRNRLDVEVIPGGLPSVGRNAGAYRAYSEYVLFIDADMELRDATLVRRAVAAMRDRGLHCVTTNIWCSDGSLLDHALYLGNDLVQYLSGWTKPFSTGMFMLFYRRRFLELGGFNERALYAEDYLLSKQVARSKFAIVPGTVLTTNRRFRKMGHAKIVWMFLKTALNTWNDRYFLEDQRYWER